MNQQANPLDELRPIHLPEQMDFWQLAPGWWIVIALIIGLIVYLILRANKKRQSLHLIKPAHNEIELIAEKEPSPQALAELSGLLKRICLVYFPAKEVANLTGQNWIKFIHQQTKTTIFDQDLEEQITLGLYKASCDLSSSEWQRLINQSKFAVEQLIKNKVKEKAQ